MAIYRLILGNKNYSSWSLRAWLMLKFAGAEFTETTVLFGRPDMKETLRHLSPTGLVPVLEHGGLVIPDSIAIADAMYAPVVARFHTYGVVVDATARAYMDAVWNHPAMAEAWALAAEEPRIPEYER